MTEFSFDNLLRVLVIILAGFCIFTNTAVLYYFTRRVKTDANYRIHKPKMKDLSIHVYMVVIATILFSGYSIAEMLTRLNLPLTWRSPTLFVIFGIFAVSSYLMSGLQSEMYYRAKIKQNEERLKVLEGN